MRSAPFAVVRASTPTRFLAWVLTALIGAMFIALLPPDASAGAEGDANASAPAPALATPATPAAPGEPGDDDLTNLDALTPVVVVFDVSGSMNDDDGTGHVKIATAKRVMYEALADGRMKAALWTYPGGSTRVHGCNAGQWMPGSSWQDNANATKVSADIRRISADGGTPTGPALKAVAEQLGNDQNVEIILVSDGLSNCGPPPCDVAKELIDQGYKIRVQPIGFDINEQEAGELKCIADATDGQYFSAQNSSDLTDYFAKLAIPPLELQVEAPEIASNGGSVSITATVRNSLPDRAVRGARLQLTTRDTDDVLADRFSAPKRSLTTLAPGEQRSFTWLLSLKGNPGELHWKVSASAPRMESTQKKGVVTITDQALDWSSAGDLLTDISGQVVIMGDSYSSGEGIGEYDDGDYRACHRNHEKAYPGVIFDGKRDVTDIACTGSTTRHFSEMYYDVRGEGVNYPAQLGELARLDDVGAVFLTIGGNDIEFAGVVADCLIPFSMTGNKGSPGFSRCVIDNGEQISWSDYAVTKNQIIKSMLLMDNLYSEPWMNRQGLSVAGRAFTPGDFGSLPELYVRIDKLINSEERVAERGGKAPIIVSSYPMVVHEAARGMCGLENIAKSWAGWLPAKIAPQGEIDAAEVKTLWLLAGELNDTVKRAVHTAKKYWDVPVYFVPTIETMALPGHSMCGEPMDSYFVPVNLLTGAAAQIAGKMPFTPDWTSEIVHPNEKGHAKWAWDILSWSQGQLLPDEYLAKPAPPASTGSTSESSSPNGSANRGENAGTGSDGSAGNASSGGNYPSDGDSAKSSGNHRVDSGAALNNGRVTWESKRPGQSSPSPAEPGSAGSSRAPDSGESTDQVDPGVTPTEGEPSDGSTSGGEVEGDPSASTETSEPAENASKSPVNPANPATPSAPANPDDVNASGNGVPGVEPVVVPVEDLDYSPPSFLEKQTPRTKVKVELELEDLAPDSETPMMEELAQAAERGAPVEITVNGLAPGSRLSAYLLPKLELLMNGYADENGTARITTTLPRDMEVGKQRIELQGTSESGALQGAIIPLEVSEPLPMWMYLTMGATAVLLLAALIGIIVAKRKLRP